MGHSTEFQIGNVLGSLLKRNGLNLRQLSEATGVPQSTLNHWMENSTPRSPVDAKKVAQFFKVSLHYLFFGIEDENGFSPSGPKKSNLVALKQLRDDWYKCTLELTDHDGKKIRFEGFFVSDKPNHK